MKHRSELRAASIIRTTAPGATEVVGAFQSLPSPTLICQWEEASQLCLLPTFQAQHADPARLTPHIRRGCTASASCKRELTVHLKLIAL